jgi:hypothetical protein
MWHPQSNVFLTVALLGIIFPTFFQENQADKEWANVSSLHHRAWEERRKGNFEASEGNFREAGRKLKDYRSRYLKDRSGISFLRATYRLAYLSELGNRDKDAREFYKQCLTHPLINSAVALSDGVPISRQVTERLTIVERRLQQTSPASGQNYPRISIKGGSKGEKNLPNQSFDLRP